MSPENSILNFHTSWIWILQCLQGLQVKHLPANNTLLSRPNKRHTIWCFWHWSNLAPNFSTPVDAHSNPKAPPYIHSLSLLLAIRHPHPQIHTHTHTPVSASSDGGGEHSCKALGVFQWSKEVAGRIGGNKNGCKMTVFETQVLDRWEGKEMISYCALM